MASNSDIFQQVRAAVDIVEIIGEHVALKRAGREFKGLCPFHEDHRPSMAVVPHKQIFHCFVCGTGGDVFKFVTQYHKLSNGEALRMLAQRAGIKLPELPKRGWAGGGGGGGEEGPSIREQIATTNEWACGFFEQQLRSPAGKAGLDYFHSRGLTDDTIEKFRLGWSPEGWTGLVNAAMRLQIGMDKLDQAGLVKKRQDGSAYDVFRGRVMFPIIDATGGGGRGGRVIAFGGRVLEEKRDEQGVVVEAKYLNTPETRLFNKSESVYGLNHARQQIVRTRTAIVVEGYMDVIACHQAGVSNVIATLGTALTADHARILKNYAQTIVLVFDSDDAGYRAADRAMEVFVRTQLDIKLTSVPDGKDPCDFCMKNGGEPFQKLVDHATDALVYQWNRLQKQFHATESLSARQEAITGFLRYVAAGIEGGGQNMDPVRRGLLFSKIASMVGMRVEEVGPTLARLAAAEVRNPAVARPAIQNPAFEDETRNTKHETQDSGGAEVMGEGNTGGTPVPQRIDVRQLKGLEAAEGWVLGALLAQPPLYDKVREEMTLGLFVAFRALAGMMLEYLENHEDLAACNLADLTTHLGDAELVRQAIELERRTSDWLDPQFSPQHNKMLKQTSEDRGLSLALVLAESLKELHEARGEEDPAVTADLGDQSGKPESADAELRALAELRGLIERRAKKGGDFGSLGLGR